MNEQYISQLESWCSLLYTSNNAQERKNAEQAIYSALETSENFENLLSILRISQNLQLNYLTLSIFTKMLISEWRRLPIDSKNLLYQNIFQMYFEQTNKPSYILAGLAKALARICRLGWFELEVIPQTVRTIQEMINQNLFVAEIGFKFFEEIITEMVEPIKFRPLSTNRKIAIAFRDDSLEKIFGMCWIFISKVPEISLNLIVQSLTVLNLCLTFDFLGICSDESNEDSLSLQVPLSWKIHFENPAYLEYLEFLILNCSDQAEILALRAFNHMGAIRKSIFGGNVEQRQAYVGKYLKVLEEIIKNKNLVGDSKFEYIQTSKRFITNFTLRDITPLASFWSWLEALANYSAVAFSNRSSVVSGFESSLFIWSYLAYEQHHQLSADNQIALYVPGLFKAFLQYTSINASPDLLDDSTETELKDHIEQITSFCVYFYSDLIRELQTVFIATLSLYDAAAAQGQNKDQIEAQLAWLTYIASGFIILREKKLNENEDHLDAQMINLVFQLIGKIENMNPLECLESSIVYFFMGLTKSYINSPHDNIWFFFDKTSSKETTSVQTLPEDTVKFVVKIVMEKLIQNLSRYQDGKALKWSLELFEILCKGYYSNKILVKIDVMQNLMANYRSYGICANNPKYKERVYAAISNLWIIEDVNEPLESFLRPTGAYIRELINSPSSINLVHLFRELKGICSTFQSQRHYVDFFEWFYEGNLDIIFTASTNFIYDDSVMNSLLAFLAELVFSRNSRIRFDIACAYGIILFRNLSNILMSYGKAILENNIAPAEYYKKLKRILEIMAKMMSGGYVSFGIFEVYGDTCFLESLGTCFELIEKIPRDDAVAYSKLLDVIYEFLELICKSHLKTVFSQLRSSYFSAIVFFLLRGVKASNMKHCLSTANSITYMCEFIIKTSQKDNNDSQAINRVFNDFPGCLSELLTAVLEVVLNEDSNYMWSLSKPLLGLIIINENSFEQIKNYVISGASSNLETQQSLNASLSKLMNGVSRSMDQKNRDRFSKNFTEMRQAITSVN
ncbi:unnamed protein product [Blepharisma stoltei]|uniref:Exportin-7/Ran-binding protein 17 TPR repeats domain-containing protein n=1 Tax=Blepharisma stoltei TaxID=1481888 RepID=A0AAU9JJV4_9CILI|nr:unnamed protein product [Blepharisma stoltei]